VNQPAGVLVLQRAAAQCRRRQAELPSTLAQQLFLEAIGEAVRCHSWRAEAIR
jgi:hypothetical protein